MIGAACKWLNNQGDTIPCKNFHITTVKRLDSLSALDKHALLTELLTHNISALTKVIQSLALRPEVVRMWRMGSDLLPMYTHQSASEFYADPDVRNLMERGLARAGKLARLHKVRLSFHPGQFVVIGSVHSEVRERSRTELEYHAECAALMGYKGWHPDGFCINVHVGGKQADPKVVRTEIKSMSSGLRNLLTLENDEFCWGAAEIVEQFGDLVPLVLDVHHYWIREGQRLSANSQLVEGVIDTWQGARPKLHLAMSQKPLIPNQYFDTDIPLDVLITQGHTKGKLRIHSGSPWHLPTLDYIRAFEKDFDIMWEGKNKNLGQRSIAKYLKLA